MRQNAMHARMFCEAGRGIVREVGGEEMENALKFVAAALKTSPRHGPR